MISKRIQALSELGKYMKSNDKEIKQVIDRAQYQNPWFTPENTQKSIDSVAEQFLDKTKLEEWVSAYNLRDKGNLNVGLVMAGNIPLVGFHDWLSVFISGHDSQVKTSSKDSVLMPFFVGKMYEMADRNSLPQTDFVDRLKGFDAVIATGSDNTAMHFEHYFKDYPNIIRHNRNSMAFLTGEETEEDLMNLGKDVFDYFGLGCRNVSHVVLPQGYDPGYLVDVFDRRFAPINEHHKYRNNYDYNLALYLLNKIEHHRGQSIILKRDDHIASRIASLNYSFYDSKADWPKVLSDWEDKLQVVVSGEPIPGIAGKKVGQVAFGEAQRPGLTDYPDGVDTLKALTEWYPIKPISN